MPEATGKRAQHIVDADSIGQGTKPRTPEPKKRSRWALNALAVVLALGAVYIHHGEMQRSPSRWKEHMRRATKACASLAEAKAASNYTRRYDQDLEALRASTRDAVRHFLVDNIALFNVDREFTTSVVSQSNSGKDNSEFFNTCYATELLELRSAWGYFHEAASSVPACRDAKKQRGMKCFVVMISDAMDDFQWSGDLKEMMRVYESSMQVQDSSGKPMLPWSNPMFRPYIMLENIRDLAVWERSDAAIVNSIMDLLEKNVKIFKEELQALKNAGAFRPAYEQLRGNGTWSRVALFESRWHGPNCQLAPKTCELLRDKLPGQQKRLPYIMPNQEEVSFFYASPHAHILPHNGGTNGRINIHIGLEGYKGSVMHIHTRLHATKALRWTDKRAFAFNDGWLHEVFTGSGHRYNLAIGIMHPDINEAVISKVVSLTGPYGGRQPPSLHASTQKLAETVRTR